MKKLKIIFDSEVVYCYALVGWPFIVFRKVKILEITLNTTQLLQLFSER